MWKRCNHRARVTHFPKVIHAEEIGDIMVENSRVRVHGRRRRIMYYPSAIVKNAQYESYFPLPRSSTLFV